MKANALFVVLSHGVSGACDIGINIGWISQRYVYIVTMAYMGLLVEVYGLRCFMGL